MSLYTLFPHLRGFRLLSHQRETKRLVLICERVTPTALCPVCGTSAHRIHSRYERTVWNLSVQMEDVTPGQIIGWMVARPETLAPEAQEQMDRLCQMDGRLSQARELTHGFLDLIRHHSGTGPVEGHINCLKLIKRQAYGRAGLSYLQHRFLSAA